MRILECLATGIDCFNPSPLRRSLIVFEEREEREKKKKHSVKIVSEFGIRNWPEGIKQ